MEKVRYMISDASNLIQVESHVLRYWEEELDLDIPRNEMGHRYYTEENIRQFEQIKKLKEEGYQLKAIKMLLHDPEAARETALQGEPVTSPSVSAEVEPLSKLEQFQLLMVQIVRNAIAENNQALGEEVSAQVGEKVIKEMNYLMREQEQREEEHFRKLDEALRSRQRRGRVRPERKDKPARIRFKAHESVS